MDPTQVVGQLVTGGDAVPTSTTDLIAKAARTMGELADKIADASADRDAIKAEMTAQAATLDELKAKHEQEKRDADIAEAKAAAKAALDFASQQRSPSKAAALGLSYGAAVRGGAYQAGTFIYNLHAAKSMDFTPEQHVVAKATLEGLGSRWSEVPEESAGVLPIGKATTGLTDATGGWILPNAIVDDLVKTGRYQSAAAKLVTARRGLAGATAVDIPFRSADATRAAVIAWGSLKTNEDLAYNGYTATLYTLAKVHDVSKQMVRKSAGAAEADVLDELARAFALGEAYYIYRGSGSSEPYGLQTAITNAPATFTSTFTAAATQAGSIISAIATAAGTLGGRNRTPTGAVVSGASLWTLASQGTDNAGFFLDVHTDPTSPTIRVFGIPVFGDNQLAGTDDLIVGEWAALKVYYGDGYRVDSTDIAGTRWDYNLVGFRGEMEMGLDARPAVYSGAFQFVADIIP